MTETDLVALGVGCIALLLWWPANWRMQRRSTATDIDEVEWLTQLGAQVVGSDDFAAAVAALGGATQAGEAKHRIEELCRLSIETGLPGADLVAVLLADARAQVACTRRWREQTSAVQVSSWLLAILPFALWLATAASGQPLLNWLLHEPIGWTVLGLFGLLTGLARRLLGRMRRAALEPIRKGAGRGSLPGWAVAGIGGMSAFWLVGGAIGVLVGSATAAAIGQNWWRFADRDALAAAEQQLAERPWLTCLLASALAAGIDWPRATRLMLESANSVGRESLTAVSQRLDWGLDPVDAFAQAGAQWQPLARSLRQCAESGVPVRYGLLQLATHWQQELHSTRLAQVERVAARAILPVSLLQLPAFVIGGLAPIVVVSVQPLFELFVSTAG